MNLTSTLLTVDLVVLSTILAILAVILKSLMAVQEDAVQSAKQTTRIEQAIEFYGQRLTSIENWIAENSGFKGR
jgi:cell division protein FtsL